jgi:hypothetical protein
MGNVAELSCGYGTSTIPLFVTFCWLKDESGFQIRHAGGL